MSLLLPELLREIRALTPLPRAAKRVLVLAAREDAVPNDLVEVIQAEPALTARVLALSNSSYYGLPQTIHSLGDAANLLGMRTLVSLVMTSCIGHLLRDTGRGTTPSQLSLWERSVASALAARRIARHVGGVAPEEAYTSGLLQDIGQLVIDRFVTRESIEFRRAVEAGTGLLDAEACSFALHHAEIGARIASHWRFPAQLVDTIRYHHHPTKAQLAPRLASVTHLAESLADAISPGSEWSVESYDVCPGAFELLGLSPEELEGFADELAVELERARALVTAA